MTKHTPGPWRIHDMEADAIVAQGPNGGAEVANVANSCWRQNLRADAVLIAAAPSLLAAAEALGAMPEGYCFCSKDRIGDDSKTHEPECRDLRLAIAQARDE